MNCLLEKQLLIWEEARKNYQALDKILKRKFIIGDLPVTVQFNPGRIASTTAKVDTDSINIRRCFLCKENRPKEQLIYNILPGWELLVNPYPIFNPHFTIACTDHRVQELNWATAIKLAYLMEGMVVFYNAPGAGASAPDHAHYQAVALEALPLINLLDKNWPDTDKALIAGFIENFNLPMKVIAGTIYNNTHPFATHPCVNAFIWKSKNKDIRYALIPRKAHRPTLFFLEGIKRRAFSPGAIDMAGVLITPYKEDFERVTEEEIKQIYKEV